MQQIFKDFQKYGYFFTELVSRDFQKKYYKSALGVLWTILNPLLMMCIISIVFSTLFKRNVPYYPVYYLTGNLLFQLCKDSSTQALHAVTENAGLLKKIYIPSYFFSLSKVGLALINFLFSLIPLLLVMLVIHAPIRWTILLIPLPILLVLIFSAGLSLALSAMAVYFRDLYHLYGIVTLAWMYLTPLFYPISIIPEKWMFLLKMNPMVYYVEIFRALVYEGTLPAIRTVGIACMFSAVMLVVGSYIFYKLKDNFFLYF